MRPLNYYGGDEMVKPCVTFADTQIVFCDEEGTSFAIYTAEDDKVHVDKGYSTFSNSISMDELLEALKLWKEKQRG